MLQDIQPHIFKNEFIKREPVDTDLLFVFQGDKPLLFEGKEGLQAPTIGMIKELHKELTDQDFMYLFAIDETAVFTILDEKIEIVEETGFSYQILNVFRTFEPKWIGYAGVSASHLCKWYRRNRFCGCCGNKMSFKKDERAMICESCGFLDFPKICPVIIVGVIDGNKILLTKYANRSFTRYALIAGFCEFGESLEATIAREVMEEVGVKVKNIRYFNSQPWGFSESLLMGFFADLDGATDITLDYNELKEGVWMERELIPDDPENELSLTYTMMKAFREGKEDATH